MYLLVEGWRWILYNGYIYLSMLLLKLINISKISPSAYCAGLEHHWHQRCYFRDELIRLHVLNMSKESRVIRSDVLCSNKSQCPLWVTKLSRQLQNSWKYSSLPWTQFSPIWFHWFFNEQSWLFSYFSFYPRPVLAFGYCRCLRLSVCVSVRASITSLSAW